MDNIKHPTSSATQRRKEVLRGRQQRLQADQRQHARSGGKRSTRKQNPWPLIIGVVLGVLIIVGVFLLIARQQKTSTESATSSVWQTITSPDGKTLATVANGSTDDSIRQAFYQVKNAPPVLLGPHGKPEIFYMGAEYCPYCAAQRWGLIVALSRFGTFNHVSPIISGEGNVPTYSFHQSTYTSQYIDFVPVEVQDNQPPPASQSLEQLTPAQQQIVNTYDAPPYTRPESKGAFPFISIGNQVVVTASAVDASLLVGHSYTDIANQLKDPSTDIAKSVLGAANYLTAAICSVTNNQPASVCNADPVPQLRVSLAALAPRALLPSSNPQVATVATLRDLIAPRRTVF